MLTPSHTNGTNSHHHPGQLNMYLEIVKRMPVGIAVWQLDDLNDVNSLKLVAANTTANTYSGMQIDACIGMRMIDVYPSMAGTPILEVYANVIRTGQSQDLGEVHFKGDNGEESIIAIQTFPLPEQMVCITFENITSRRKIEEALRAREIDNQLLFEQSPIGLALCRMDGSLVKVNPAYSDIIGRSIEETLQLSYFQITPEAYMPQEQEQIEHMQKHGRYGPYEKEYIHKDGHLVPVRLSGLVVDRNGEKFIWSSVEDISDQRQTETALRKSESRFRSITENIPGAVFQFTIRDNVWTVDYVSDRIFDIAGVQAEEVMRDARALASYVHPDDLPSYHASVKNSITTLTPWHFEGRFIRRDGTFVYWQGDSTPIRNEQGEVIFCGVLIDVTQRKEAEEVITAQAATLQELSTPLLAISDRVVVMPLVGAIDSQRAQQVMDSLLHGVAMQRATTAIIDITGVVVVDTQVANALVRAAQSVKLLGAQAVLTGIRPEVAQTLIQLGVDLRDIITRSTLQSGISFAMGQG